MVEYANICQSILYFNPSNQSGPNGYVNYKMSGGGSGSSAGTGCGFALWVMIILFVLEILGKLS